MRVSEIIDRRVLLVSSVACLVALVAIVKGFGPSADAAPPDPGVSYVPELGLPATHVVAIGASPAEAPGKAWAYGYLGPVPPAGEPSQTHRYALLEHSDADGWRIVPLPGIPIRAGDGFPMRLGALGGRTTPAGGVVLLTDAGIVVRDPGAAPALAPAPTDEEVIDSDETLPPRPPPAGAPTPYAVLDEDDGKTGLLIAPYGTGSSGGSPALEPGVLHYNGTVWTREPIEIEDYGGIEPLAIDCGPSADRPGRFSPLNCWLLAQASVEDSAQLVLFQRQATTEGSSPYAWVAATINGGLLGDQANGDETSVRPLRPLTGAAQTLTVTAQGVWVDFQASLGDGVLSSAAELVTPGADVATVRGSWCQPTGPGCEASLGSSFPSSYRSFAWPGSSEGDPGSRVITGLPNRALLRLAGGAFSRLRGAGGSPGVAPGGAAFATPTDGIVADGVDPHAARDGGGQSQAFVVTTTPTGNAFATEPVPFRHPLTAVALEPNAANAGEAEAIAVGMEGQIARFVPGRGWQQYPVQMMSGIGPVNLRDVAWASPEVAYAVGDDGAIRVWQRSTDRWEIDPEEPRPTNPHLDGVAFSTIDPERGFIVGQSQIIRRIPDGWGFSEMAREVFTVGAVDMTSVAFAGNEGIASFRTLGPTEGGVMLEDGSGWKLDQGLNSLLTSLPPEVDIAPTEVAGLPDGGAAAAGPGWVAKRETLAGPWSLSVHPLSEATAVSALAVHRDSSGTLRTIVSIAPGPYHPLPPDERNHDPSPLPGAGYVLRETANGWVDMEHQAFGVEVGSPDMPLRPEPVLDLAVSIDGETGLAVGGQTGNFSGDQQQPLSPVGPPPTPHYETSAALRFPPDLAHDPNRTEPIPVPPERLAFALGGQAACATACADRANTGIGPDAWLGQALASAADTPSVETGDLRAFLYTGGRLIGEAGEQYEGELARLAELFATSGSLPLLTAASPDLTRGGPELFSSIFAAFGPSGGSSYYSYRSEAERETTVLVIVLDYSEGALGATQEAWLREQLAGARSERAPALVVGSASLSPPLATGPGGGASVTQASDAAAVTQILVEGGASAYIYNYPGANTIDVLRSGTLAIRAIGTGTLGYAPPVASATDALATGAYLTAELANDGHLSDNVYPVSAKAIPAIESLTLHSHSGGEVEAGRGEQFEALGRRPAGGVLVGEADGKPAFGGPEPYVTMPFPSRSLQCEGPNCEREVPLDFAFSSSNPEVGYFINRDQAASAAPGEEIRPDPRSGLFCAIEPGQTTVTVRAGGLSYSQPVTVAPGNGEANCLEAEPPDAPAETPQGSGPAPEGAPTTLEQPPATAGPPAQPTAPQPVPSSPQAYPPASIPPPAPLAQPTGPVLSPYAPPAAGPAPPAGLSPSTQPVSQPAGQGASQGAAQGSFQAGGQIANAPGAALREAESEEAAVQRAHHAVAVRSEFTSSHHPLDSQLLIPALVLVLGSGLFLSARQVPARRQAYASGPRRP